MTILDERFSPPLGLSLNKMLAHSWGIWTSQQPVELVLRFSARVAKRVTATNWHESQ